LSSVKSDVRRSNAGPRKLPFWRSVGAAARLSGLVLTRHGAERAAGIAAAG
jgi:hypothetical protein